MYIYINNMSKKETNLENLENPFSQFSVLKGEFKEDTATPEGVDDIETGNEGIIDEVDTLKDGDKALEKVIELQKKAAKKSSKEEVIDESEGLNTGEDELTPTKGSKETKDETSGIKEFTKNLYDKGILDFNDEDEEFEDSEEGIEKLVNKTVQNRIDKWAEGLPEDYAKMLEFVQSGGTPKQFLEVYYGDHSWTEFKIDNEEAQKVAIRESLRLSGESEEDITDMIDEWEINGTLEKRAKPAIAKLQKYETAKKEELIIAQKQKADKQFADQKEYWDTFKKDLYSKEDISGFKLTPKVKDKLWDFMTAIDKRTGKTPYQEAIEKNKDSSLLFALQAMQGFDITKLEKQVETKVSSKYSAMFKNYAKDTKSKISSGSSEEHEESNPFKAFKT